MGIKIRTATKDNSLRSKKHLEGLYRPIDKAMLLPRVSHPSLPPEECKKLVAKLGRCRSDGDGDCDWADCPQKKVYRVGCPLYDWDRRSEE